jgi:hypothetical protein
VNGAPTNRLLSAVPLIRAGLIVFVVAWLFGPYSFRSSVPIWLPFLIALGLELHVFFGWPGPRENRPSRPDRGPQAVDRERYGYPQDADDLLLVRNADEELWVPYSGETGDDVDALIAEARERAEHEALTPHAPTPAEARRSRPRIRQLMLGLAVIGALLAVVVVVDRRSGWDGLDQETRAEASARFSAEASRLVGHGVTIRCDESGDFVGAVQHADGVAAVGGRLAYLTPERCHHLYRLAFKREVTFSQTARSLAVLAHEAWHLRGLRDEATTECYALQSGVELGQRLGLSERTARQMMRQQLVENTLRAGTTSEYRVPPECRDGDRLDLRPGNTAFP